MKGRREDRWTDLWTLPVPAQSLDTRPRMSEPQPLPGRVPLVAGSDLLLSQRIIRAVQNYTVFIEAFRRYPI